jgi:hypothetical protein
MTISNLDSINITKNLKDPFINTSPNSNNSLNNIMSSSLPISTFDTSNNNSNSPIHERARVFNQFNCFKNDATFDQKEAYKYIKSSSDLGYGKKKVIHRIKKEKNLNKSII